MNSKSLSTYYCIHIIQDCVRIYRSCDKIHKELPITLALGLSFTNSQVFKTKVLGDETIIHNDRKNIFYAFKFLQYISH